MMNLILFLNWSIAGLGFAIGFWASRRWRFAQPISIPEPVLIRVLLAQRKRNS
jgi:hypothetical protein